jgi:glycosyl hydrolase family 79
MTISSLWRCIGQWRSKSGSLVWRRAWKREYFWVTPRLGGSGGHVDPSLKKSDPSEIARIATARGHAAVPESREFHLKSCQEVRTISQMMPPSSTARRIPLAFILCLGFGVACSGSGTPSGTVPETGGSGGGGTGGVVGSTGSGGAVTGAGTGTTGDSGTANTGGTTDAATTGEPGDGAVGTADSGTTGTGGAVGSGGTPASSQGGAAGDASAWGTPVSGGPPFSGPTTNGTVTVNRAMTAGKITQGFAGFSFEKTHITNGSFTGKNAALIALFRLLGPTVVRLGADDVDKETWVPATKPGGGGPPYSRDIGTVEVDDYADFLAATGARTIYGVDFHSATPANSAAEAAYVTSKLGASLYGFEIGNEINRFGTWTTLKPQWEMFANAILAAAPTAKLIGPAGGGGEQSGLDTPFAHDEASKVVLLTQHYYAGTANKQTEAQSVVKLLTPDPFPITSSQGLIEMLNVMTMNATANHIQDGFRVGECNTFAGHGEPGVSDALISALWSLDFMFTSAKYGASGVNFHGGEAGMDGNTPFVYAPIVESNGVVTGAAPLFYGMLLFSLAGTGNALATTVSAGSLNVTAYAIARTDGVTSVVLDNKDTTNGAKLSVDVETPITSASVIYLQGPTPVSLTALSGITLAGAGIAANGTWKRNPPYALVSSGNTFTVTVPPASAALVRVQ